MCITLETDHFYQMLTKTLELDRPTTSQCKWKCNETADIVQLLASNDFQFVNKEVSQLDYTECE